MDGKKTEMNEIYIDWDDMESSREWEIECVFMSEGEKWSRTNMFVGFFVVVFFLLKDREMCGSSHL